MLTDIQVYELRPDIAALNDESVALAKEIPDRMAEVQQMRALVMACAKDSSDQIARATKELLAARQNLEHVREDHRAELDNVRAELELSEISLASKQGRKADVEERHNAECEAVQKEHAAKVEAAALEDTE